MVLNLFFVAIDLVLDTIDDHIEGRQQVVAAIAGDEIVFVFGIDPNFHVFEGLILQIDRDFDHRDPVEVVKQLLGFFLKLLLMLVTQMPVSGRNFYLHFREPPACNGGFVSRRG